MSVKAKKQVKEIEQYDLSKASDREKFDQADRDETYDLCNLLNCFPNYNLRFKKYGVFLTEDQFQFVKNRVIYSAETGISDTLAIQLTNKTFTKHASIVGVIVDNQPNHRFWHNNIPLLNGDSGNNTLVESDVQNTHKFPVASFECLSQFYRNPRTTRVKFGVDNDVLKYLADGTIRLIDYSSESRIDLKADEIKIVKDKKNKFLKPPLGYSLIDQKYWHRSGYVLLYDFVKNWTILLGQDEGTYFGVQLQKDCKSIKAALDSLIPAKAKDKPFRRQGEWFAVLIDEKDVPETKDCVLQFDDTAAMDDVYLPLESIESNKHCLLVREGRVGKDGQVYVKDCTVRHEEHASLRLEGWHTFYKNTAVRSFSQEGVD